MEITKKLTKENILKFLPIAFYILCFARMTWNFCILTEKEYDQIRNYYYCRAIVDFLCALLVMNRTKWKDKLYIPYSIGWILFLCYNTYKWRYSPDIIRWYGCKAICFALAGVLFYDLIRYKKIPVWSKRNKWMTIFYLVATGSACLICKGGFLTIIPLVPCAFFFLVPLKEEDWKRFIMCFSIGYYLAFVWVMVKSFLTVPYTGERYYGIYVNHGLFGIFVGGAFLCSLYWCILVWMRSLKLDILTILSALTLVFSLVCSGMIVTRTAQLGMIMSVWAAFVLCPKKEKKYTRLKRFLLTTGLVIFAVAAMVLALYVLQSIPRFTIRENVHNDVIEEKLIYWWGRGETLFNPAVHESVGADSGFKEGTVLNAIDRFTSNRLGWFSIYFQQMTLWGNPGLYIATASGIELAYPHSAFVAWLFVYGTIIGTVNVVWFITCVIYSCIRVIKKDMKCLLPMLWLIYAFMVMIPETVYWNVQVAFYALLLMYPLLVKMDGDSQADADADRLVETEETIEVCH